MGQDGVRQATVAIFGLRNPNDRNQSVNPSEISGAVTVLLDVQYNDETVTGVALTLGDHVVSCRGTSSDANQAIAGLAESGGAVEVDCYLNTADVMGECMGEQLMPAYANGEYALGAQITTDGGTRESLVTQQVTLENSGHVVVEFSGGNSLLKGGMPMYGGPDAENMSTFHVCPVSYAGTTVGKVSLRAMQTAAAMGALEDATSLSFRAPTATASFYGVAQDREGPFTWDVNPAWNEAVEDEGPGGNEHWVFAAEKVENSDGLDVSEEFAADNPFGPYYFDMRAPVVGEDAEITIGGAAVPEGRYYGDLDNARKPQAFGVSESTDGGAGGAVATVNVGDCSVAANTDTGARGYGTPFVPVVANARTISQLEEEDPHREETDAGGIDCYTAELASIEDALGNSSSLPDRTVQTANYFGVDRTRPVIDDVEPEADGLILKDGEMITLEVEDPDLGTGEPGSGFAGIAAYTGPVARPTWQQGFQAGSPRFQPDAEGVVSIPTTANGRDGTHAMTIIAYDNASRSNRRSTSITYIRDTEAPSFTAGTIPTEINAGSSHAVTVAVSGTIRDATPIRNAILTLKSNGGSLAFCNEDADVALPDAVPGGRTENAARSLVNDSNVIEFSESFVIHRGATAGVEWFCFSLETADGAGSSAGRGDGNSSSHLAGAFSVNWGIGIVVSESELSVIEDEEESYEVSLGGEPTGTVTILVEGPKGDTLTLNTNTGGADTLTFTTANWDQPQTVALDALRSNRASTGFANRVYSLRHTASGGGYDGMEATVVVTVLDDDIRLSVDPAEVTEGSDVDSVTVTATLVNLAPLTATTSLHSPAEARIWLVAGADGDGGADYTAGGDFSNPFARITIPEGSLSASIKIPFSVPEDDDADGGAVVIRSQAYGRSVFPVTITVIDNDESGD
ncbi:MAG: hypothetical protein F4164_14725 [Gemmatimonadales bacterium]|nr:hypothetical protein [Gemmatimonadales bacterium]